MTVSKNANLDKPVYAILVDGLPRRRLFYTREEARQERRNLIQNNSERKVSVARLVAQ